VVAHQRRRHEERHAQSATLRHPEEAIVGDLRLQRPVGLIAPVRQQAVESGGINHGARQNMRANLGALFHHHDGDIRRNLLQADGGGKPRGSGTHDHHVEIHGFTGGHFGHGGGLGHGRFLWGVSLIRFCFSTFGEKSQSGGRHPC
jgi:hypothetical protein